MVLIKSKPETFLSDSLFSTPFNGLFNSLMDEVKPRHGHMNFWPSSDIIEHQDAYEIRLSLPGIKKEDIKISLDGDHLTIEGERRQEQNSETSKYLKREMNYGKFSRSFTIGKADSKGIEAGFEDGVLSVRLPKRAEEKVSVIQIK